MACQSCHALMIQGVYCHETGCPDAWRGKVRECKWCETKFIPRKKHFYCCCYSCSVSNSGFDTLEEEEFDESYARNGDEWNEDSRGE